MRIDQSSHHSITDSATVQLFRESFLIKKLIYLFIFFTLCFETNANEKNILVIHSYHQGLEWTDSISSGILSVFNESKEFDIYFDYLDSKRNHSETYQNSLIELYRSRSSKIEYQAIITSDNVAYNFMLKHRDEFFPEIPLFYCGVNNLDYSELITHNKIYGYGEVANHLGTIAIIQQLFPDRKKVLIVNDNTITGNSINKELEKVLLNFGSDLEFEHFSSFSIDELKDKVASLNDEYSIYLLVINMDRDGNFISYKEGIKLIYENSNVPIFGSWDFYLGKGIVGGEIIRGYEQGRNVALLSLEYLNGKNQDPAPFQFGKTSAIIDQTLINKFEIPKSRIPQESQIINHIQFSPWEIVWLRITVVVLLISLVSSLLFVYIRKTQAQRLKELVEQRTYELRTTNFELEKLNQSKNEILGIVAHDLRNPIGNAYSFASMILEDDNEKQRLDKESRENISHIVDLTNFTLQLVKNLLDISVIESGALSLNCTSNDYISFIKNEVKINKGLADQLNIKLKLKTKLKKTLISYDRIRIQQVVNNLISNALKFSTPGSAVIVKVERKSKMIVTRIIDSGPGIPKEKFDSIFNKFEQIKSDYQQTQKGAGLGLSIVKGVLEAHKGKIYLTSELKKGTEFIFELPI